MHATKTHHSTISEPPKVDIQEKTKDLPIQSPYEICASVSGIPLPDVKWFKDEKLVEANENIQLETSKGFSKVRISQCLPESGGTYKCVATNEVGKAEAKSSLNIYGK